MPSITGAAGTDCAEPTPAYAVTVARVKYAIGTARESTLATSISLRACEKHSLARQFISTARPLHRCIQTTADAVPNIHSLVTIRRQGAPGTGSDG